MRREREGLVEKRSVKCKICLERREKREENGLKSWRNFENLMGSFLERESWLINVVRGNGKYLRKKIMFL